MKHVKEKAAKEAHNTHQSPLEIPIGAQNWWCWSRWRICQAQWPQADNLLGVWNLAPANLLHANYFKLRFLTLMWFARLVTLKGSSFWILTWVSSFNIWHPQCAFGKSTPAYYRLQHEALVDSFQPGSSKPWLVATISCIEREQWIPVHTLSHPFQVIWRVLAYTSFLRAHGPTVNYFKNLFWIQKRETQT